MDSKNNNFKSFLIQARFFLLFVLAIGLILTFYSRILVGQIKARAYIEATSSSIYQKTIIVGSNGYGQINSISAKVGVSVSSGDILFTYLRGDVSGTQEIAIRAGAAGRIKSINYAVASYITPENSIMEIQSQETLVKSKLKLTPADINKININLKTTSGLPSSITLDGKITAVYPLFNELEQSIEIESDLAPNSQVLIPGTPVKTRVYLGDWLADNTVSLINQIPYNQVRSFYDQ